MIKRALLVIALLALILATLVPSVPVHTGLPSDYHNSNGTSDLSTIQSQELFAFVAMVMIASVLTISFAQLIGPC